MVMAPIHISKGCLDNIDFGTIQISLRVIETSHLISRREI